jgi:hypothetical protein
MRHFDETKLFGAAMVGVITLGIGYQANWTSLVLFSLPIIMMAVYWLVTHQEPR